MGLACLTRKHMRVPQLSSLIDTSSILRPLRLSRSLQPIRCHRSPLYVSIKGPLQCLKPSIPCRSSLHIAPPAPPFWSLPPLPRFTVRTARTPRVSASHAHFWVSCCCHPSCPSCDSDTKDGDGRQPSPAACPAQQLWWTQPGDCRCGRRPAVAGVGGGEEQIETLRCRRLFLKKKKKGLS